MDQSPAVPTPAKGDPITAEWAAQVADAANAVPNTPEKVGAFSSPFGSVSPASGLPMLGAWREFMPFDVRLFQPSGGGDLEVYCYLPTPGAFVFVEGLAARYKSQVGTNTNPWVNIGTVTRATTTRLGLAFRDDGAAAVGGRFKWELFLQSTSGQLAPSWTYAPTLPIVPVATMTIPSDPSPGTTVQVDISGRYGLVQFVRGALNLSRSLFPLNSLQTRWKLLDLGGNAIAEATDDSSTTPPELLGTWNANTIDAQTLKAQTLTVGGTTYSQQTVNINGTNYKLLVGA